jgi:hypothetical protein
MPGIRRAASRFSSIKGTPKIEILYCKACNDVGLQGVLGPRIYGENVVIPSDADNWRQCQTCGRIYPIYEVRGESDIDVDIEPLKNPFEQLATNMGHPDFAYYPKTRQKKKKSNVATTGPNIYKFKVSKQDTDATIDEEINTLIRQGYKVKRIE